MGKRLVITIVLAGLLFIPLTYAGQTDTLTVKVRITPAISVNITETELSLGDVAAGGTKVSAAAVTVTNNGSGANETYSLSLSNPSGWTASQTAAGVETYILNAAFDADGAGISWNNTNHALSTTAVPCSATKFAGDQTGAVVPYNAARKLWFQFKAPTATSVSTEQGIVVTITAQTP